MTAPIDRAALRTLAEAATPGPMVAVEQPESARSTLGAATVEQAGPGTPGDGRRTWTVMASFATVADARYIAAASPTAVLALLDALDAAEREHDALQARAAVEIARRVAAERRLSTPDLDALDALVRKQWCGRCVTSPGTMETPCEDCGSTAGTTYTLIRDLRAMRERAESAERERGEARADLRRLRAIEEAARDFLDLGSYVRTDGSIVRLRAALDTKTGS